MTDQEIISALQAGGARQEACLNYLFDQHKGLVGSAISRHQISEEEALDAYADAIIGFRKQVMLGKFRGESKISTYFYTIYFRRCVDLIRRRATHQISQVEEYPEVEDETVNTEADLITREAFNQVMEYMEKLGEVCRKILMYRYYYGYEDMEEIARLVEVKNANTAGSLRYRCLKQLMRIIKEAELQQN